MLELKCFYLTWSSCDGLLDVTFLTSGFLIETLTFNCKSIPAYSENMELKYGLNKSLVWESVNWFAVYRKSN